MHFNYYFNKLVAPFVLALIFSPIAVFKLLNFGGSYFPEIGLVFMVFFFSIKKKTMNDFTESRALLCLMLIIVLGVIGLLFGNNILHIYSEGRCILALVLSYLYISNAKNESEYIEKLEFSLYFTLFIFAFYIINYIFLLDTPSVKKYFPMIGIWVALLAAKKFGYNNILIGFLCIVSLAAAYSLYRSNILIIVFAFLWFISFIFDSITIKRLATGLVSIVVIIMAGIILLPSILDYYNSSESHMIHGLSKWLDLANFIRHREMTDVESVRLSYYSYILNNYLILFSPSGFGYYKLADIEFCHAFIECIDGSIRDNSLFYLVITIGSVGTLFILSFICKLFFNASQKLVLIEKLRLLVIFVSFLFFVNITAATFGELSTAILTGLLMGIIKSYHTFLRVKV